MTFVVSVNCLSMSSPASRCDQATQVSFPVLGRSHQKALRRYATLADINRPPRPPLAWSRGPREPRPTSLQSLDLPLLQPLATLQPGAYSPGPPSSRLAPSCDASDVSHSPNPPSSCLHSVRTVSHSKWRNVCDGSTEGVPQGPGRPCTTPEGLSWRRLHMSRAKLKATATTSELLSGFAMVAMVELQINEPTTVPEWLFVLFAVCTTVLVAVHIFALMISTYILPNIDAISKLDVSELVSESPHERMRGFIELAWAFSTVLGLFLFLVEIAILCWVKFWDYSFTAAIAATVIVIPVLVMFVAFAVHFYHSLVVYKCDASSSDIQQLEDMKRSLDQAVSPV